MSEGTSSAGRIVKPCDLCGHPCRHWEQLDQQRAEIEKLSRERYEMVNQFEAWQRDYEKDKKELISLLATERDNFGKKETELLKEKRELREWLNKIYDFYVPSGHKNLPCNKDCCACAVRELLDRVKE